MDLIRNCLHQITENYVAESQHRENFVFPNQPNLKSDEMKAFAPIFNAYEIKPEEAVNVIIDFDKEPSKLTPAGLRSRIKLLSLFNYALDDKDLMMFLFQNVDLNSENFKSTVNLLKRLSVLLILEAKFASDDTSDQGLMEAFEVVTKAPAITPSSMQIKGGEYKSPHKVSETQSVKNIMKKIKRNASMVKKCKMVIGVLAIVIIVLTVLYLKKASN